MLFPLYVSLQQVPHCSPQLSRLLFSETRELDGERAYLVRVPARHSFSTADIGEARDVSLSGEAVHQTVGTVRAADSAHGAAGIVVAGIIRDFTRDQPISVAILCLFRQGRE